MREPSGFNLKTDKSPQGEPEGVLFLLIAGVCLVGAVTGALELASAAGFVAPHALTMFLGLMIGAAFGVSLGRSMKAERGDD